VHSSLQKMVDSTSWSVCRRLGSSAGGILERIVGEECARRVIELERTIGYRWRSDVHELGITQGIIDRAREAAVANGARKVAGLHLVMTSAADFTQDSIEMYFEMLTTDDELFGGAALHFEHRPVDATCLSCGDEFSTDAPHPVCPQCGSLLVRLDPDAPMVQLTDIDIDEGPDEVS
jgi:Zn finger protein HypA/HybF involved in hydrogenase expression